MVKDSNTQYIHSTSNHLPGKKDQVAKTRSSSCTENRFILYLLLSKCNRKRIGIKQQQCSMHFLKKASIRKQFYYIGIQCQRISRTILQTMPTSHPLPLLEPDTGKHAHITADWYMLHQMKSDNSNFFNHLICKYF